MQVTTVGTDQVIDYTQVRLIVLNYINTRQLTTAELQKRRTGVGATRPSSRLSALLARMRLRHRQVAASTRDPCAEARGGNPAVETATAAQGVDSAPERQPSNRRAALPNGLRRFLRRGRRAH